MLALPLGPSNLYAFSTASHGIRRRSAAMASRAWVNSFSFTSNFWRAASHSCADTTLVCMANLLFVAMLVAFTSGRQPAVVFLLQAGPAIPEWRRFLVAGAGDQDIEMHMPAGADLEHGRTIGQTPMDHGEQHARAFRLQFERNVAAVVPGDRKLAERIELGDPALHPVLFGKVCRSLARRIVELVVAPAQFE